MTTFTVSPLIFLHKIGPVVCGLAVCIAIQLGCVVERELGVYRLQRRIFVSRQELGKLSSTAPMPTRRNADAIGAELTRLKETTEAIRTELWPSLDQAGFEENAPSPLKGTDAFFEITAFVERLRARAESAGVSLQGDGRFGFSAYANEAPAAEFAGQVGRQRRCIEFLVETLLTAGPSHVLAVERERPGVKTEKKGPTRGLDLASRDYFVLDPRQSLRVPNDIETSGFRLIFSGHTACLRAFLNKLAVSDEPFAIRGVEVTPFVESEQATHGKATGTIAVKSREPTPSGNLLLPELPVVVPRLLKFSVTIEFLAPAPAVDPVPARSKSPALSSRT